MSDTQVPVENLRMEEDEVPKRKFDWCRHSDRYHDGCKVEYVNSNGVTVRCACPRHEEENDGGVERET